MLQSLVYSADEKAQYLQNPLLERSQRGQMSLGLLWSLDKGQGNVLKRSADARPWGGRFRALDCRIQAGRLGPLNRQLTAADKFQQCQDSQGD